MKFRFLILVFVFLYPSLLLAEIDLDKLMENANQKKTPAGVVVKIQPGESRKESVKSTSETTRFSTRPDSSVNFTNIFMLGGFLTFSDRFYFLNSVGSDQLRSGFSELRGVLRDLQVDEATLQNYDQFSQCIVSLPFGTPWEKWSAEQQNSWNQQGCPGWKKLMFEQISPQIKSNPQAYFFFWLGVDSARVGGSIPQYLKEGKKLSEVSPDLKAAIEGFYYAQNDSIVAMLTPEVASAVSKIAAMKAKVDAAGIESITMDDVNEMQKAAATIVQAADKSTLVK